MRAPLLDICAVSKHFAGTTALEDVSFTVAAGTCHAICGENGAGKSTLSKIIAGFTAPDSGCVRLEGVALPRHDAAAARAHGIAMVQQELSICDNLSVAENVCLAKLPSTNGVTLDRARLEKEAREALQPLGLAVDVRAPASTLRIAEKQLVEIARALTSGSRLIILDEPTSSLSAAEAVRLFACLDTLKARGATFIYISHRLEEIFTHCDAITVLRDGRHVLTEDIEHFDRERLIAAMVGRELPEIPALPAPQEEVLLEVEHLDAPPRFHDVSFQIRRGEILGLCGLAGSGRSEIARVLAGIDCAPRGTIRTQHLALLPEDRHAQGLVPLRPVRENVSLPHLDKFSSRGFVSQTREHEAVLKMAGTLRIKTADIEAAVSSLSGGNQQKVLVARTLLSDADILLLDEPTRGIDVGSKNEIHLLILELVRRGRSVLLISSEMPELLLLCHRVLVMREGHPRGVLERAEMTQERLLALMSA